MGANIFIYTGTNEYLVTYRIYNKNYAHKVDAFKFTIADGFFFKKNENFLDNK